MFIFDCQNYVTEKNYAFKCRHDVTEDEFNDFIQENYEEGDEWGWDDDWDDDNDWDDEEEEDWEDDDDCDDGGCDLVTYVEILNRIEVPDDTEEVELRGHKYKVADLWEIDEEIEDDDWH